MVPDGIEAGVWNEVSFFTSDTQMFSYIAFSISVYNEGGGKSAIFNI